MSEHKCKFCGEPATTERSRVNSLTTLKLCVTCSLTWDTATNAEQDRVIVEKDRAAAAAREAVTVRSETDPEDTQVETLFKAVRYLVRNTLPQEHISGYKEQDKLLGELDAVIALGVE